MIYRTATSRKRKLVAASAARTLTGWGTTTRLKLEHAPFVNPLAGIEKADVLTRSAAADSEQFIDSPMFAVTTPGRLRKTEIGCKGKDGQA